MNKLLKKIGFGSIEKTFTSDTTKRTQYAQKALIPKWFSLNIFSILFIHGEFLLENLPHFFFIPFPFAAWYVKRISDTEYNSHTNQSNTSLKKKRKQPFARTHPRSCSFFTGRNVLKSVIFDHISLHHRHWSAVYTQKQNIDYSYSVFWVVHGHTRPFFSLALHVIDA